ncbi:MAG: L-glutamate gamma-semialdehyde dehydrogenase [Saprospiraceae bacterium]|nr:L-glutamate gamma-semialdehyde dehydrogenase [Saprospiraceae bacterium]
MANALFTLPEIKNEPVLNYAAGSPERKALDSALTELLSKKLDIPQFIGGEEVFDGDKIAICPPHDHKLTIGYYYKGNKNHVEKAIQSALKAKHSWESTPWEQRAAIFLKAADLLSGPFRAKMNAATMLCQSKNIYQAEIDAVAELADFFRFNVKFMTQIYAEQPISAPLVWNKLEFRALEGFIFALTPFNFTSIAGNLPAAPALMGNVVVWKPAENQVYSAAVIMEVLKLAGLPDGVINMVVVSGPVAGEVIFEHRDFAGLHFTGSTSVFNNLWQKIAGNLPKYKSYPRIVGETGGKDFVIAHSSASVQALAVALARGAFEFQGQKCSAASRAYIPQSIWNELKDILIPMVQSFKMGSPLDYSHFINAVIDEKAFDKIAGYIDKGKNDETVSLIAGGNYDKSIGYFIEPTIFVVENPHHFLMEEEIFGPVLTMYVYPDGEYEETLKLVDETSPYALTGAVFASDQQALTLANNLLRNAAGNFYINDKPTGAVVGQQPFGGARSSGTNDKAGSIINLWRWVSPRTIKENFNPPTDYKYPFMG